MEALDVIESLKAEVETLKEDREVGGSTSLDREREARVVAPRPPMFKGVRDAHRWWRISYRTWRITSSVIGYEVM